MGGRGRPPRVHHRGAHGRGDRCGPAHGQLVHSSPAPAEGAVGYHGRVSREHRRHPRLHVQACADILGDEIVLRAPLADLSQGGCRIARPVGDQPGQALTVVLELAGAAEPGLAVSAQLVRRSESAAAVRFVDLTPDQRRALRTHLHRLHARAQ